MSEPTALSNLSNQLADAVERAAKSIVTVRGRARQPASGVVYAKGLVLTANHVLERDEDLTIEANGSPITVTIAGRDPASDLAVLKAAGMELEPASVAAGGARVGQLALAVGRPSSQGTSASLGIVSLVGGPLRTGRGLSLEQYIRTDATPYPGFSGGPLIDAAGAVLGITTTGFGQVALAVPQAIAWRIAHGLAEKGTPRRGYIGVSSQPVRLPDAVKSQTSQEGGLLVLRVEDDSPASKAGIMLGDVVVTLVGHAAGDTDDLLALLSGDRVGKTVPVEVIRGGKLEKLEIAIGERS